MTPKKTTRKATTRARKKSPRKGGPALDLGTLLGVQDALQNLTWPKLVAIGIALTFGVWQYSGIKAGIESNSERLTRQDQRLDELEGLEEKIDDLNKEATQLDKALGGIQRALNQTILATVEDSLKAICRKEDPQRKSPLCDQLLQPGPSG